MKYIKYVTILLSLLAFSQAITVENGDSKLEIGGWMNIYMDSGNSVGDIGDSFTAKDMVSHLDFGFSHKESEQLTSVAHISVGMDTTAEYGSSEVFLQKYKTYIGLEHSVFGTVYLGTMTSVNYILVGWTDMGLPHSGSGHSNWDAGDEGTKRGIAYVEDAIFYTKNFKFSDSQSLDIYLQVQGAENGYTQATNEAGDDGLRRENAGAGGLVYNIGKFSIGLADSVFTLEHQDTLDSFTGNELSFAARYQGEQLYLAFSASMQENISAVDTDNIGIEFAADYKFKSGYGLLVIYNLRQITGGSSADAIANDGLNDVNYLTLTGYKALSDNFKLFIEGKVDLRTSEEKDTFIGTSDISGVINTNDNSISIGFEYDF